MSRRTRVNRVKARRIKAQKMKYTRNRVKPIKPRDRKSMEVNQGDFRLGEVKQTSPLTKKDE